MFDTNHFKRTVKDWVRENPKGTMADLTDFCEELIPPQQFASHSWLIEQTVGWYQHVLRSREHLKVLRDDDGDDCD